MKHWADPADYDPNFVDSTPPTTDDEDEVKAKDDDYAMSKFLDDLWELVDSPAEMDEIIQNLKGQEKGDSPPATEIDSEEDELVNVEEESEDEQEKLHKEMMRKFEEHQVREQTHRGNADKALEQYNQLVEIFESAKQGNTNNISQELPEMYKSLVQLIPNDSSKELPKWAESKDSSNPGIDPLQALSNQMEQLGQNNSLAITDEVKASAMTRQHNSSTTRGQYNPFARKSDPSETTGEVNLWAKSAQQNTLELLEQFNPWANPSKEWDMQGLDKPTPRRRRAHDLLTQLGVVKPKKIPETSTRRKWSVPVVHNNPVEENSSEDECPEGSIVLKLRDISSETAPPEPPKASGHDYTFFVKNWNLQGFEERELSKAEEAAKTSTMSVKDILKSRAMEEAYKVQEQRKLEEKMAKNKPEEPNPWINPWKPNPPTIGFTKDQTHFPPLRRPHPETLKECLKVKGDAQEKIQGKPDDPK